MNINSVKYDVSELAQDVYTFISKCAFRVLYQFVFTFYLVYERCILCNERCILCNGRCILCN